MDLSLQHTADFYAKKYFVSFPDGITFGRISTGPTGAALRPLYEKQFANQHADKAQNSNQNWVRQIEKLWCLNFHQILAIQTNHLVYIRAVYHWYFVRISLSWRIKQVTSVDILETLHLFTSTSVCVLKYSLWDDIYPVDAYIYMDRSRVDISTDHSYIEKAWLFAIQALNTLRTPVSSITHWADKTLIIVWLTSQHNNVVNYGMYDNLHQLGLRNS